MDTLLPPHNGVRHGARGTTNADTRVHGRTLLLIRGLYILLALLLLGVGTAGVITQRRFLAWGTVGLQIAFSGAGEAVIRAVHSDAATEAGIRQGDLLLAIDGQPIAPMSSRLSLVRRLGGPAGSPVVLDVRTADGTTREITLTRAAPESAATGMAAGRAALYGVALDGLLVLGFALPALIIVWRKSDDWVAIFVSGVLLLVGVANTGAFTSLVWFDQPSNVATTLMVVVSVLYKVATLLLLYIFPNGRFVPRWTRLLLVVGAIWAVLYTWLWPYALTRLVDVSLYASGVYAQIYRYRHVSTATEQLQTKWLVFGMVVAFVGLYAYELPLAVDPTLHDPTTATGMRYQLLGRLVAVVALLGVAVTFTIAIFRYRLYNIDLILHRTLVYVPITALVAGLLAASVKLTESLIQSEPQSRAATLLSALLLAAAFTPIKAGSQKLVDKYFKEVPNPRKQLKEFAKRIRSRLFPAEPEELTRQLLEAAVTGFEAASGAVELASGRGTTLTLATRGWTGTAALRVPLRATPESQQLGVLLLGARRSGAEYAPHDRSILEETARVVALAIAEDRNVPVRVRHQTSSIRGIRRHANQQR